MIREFTFSNFFSFREPAGVSFVVGKNAPDTPAYAEAPDGARVGKILALFGHNASGKTNLLRVLPFVRWFVADSFSWRPESPLPFQPFVLRQGAADLPAEIAVEFDAGADLYRYELCVTQRRVIYERLFVREDRRFSYLFKRTWNPARNDYDFQTQRFGLARDFIRHVLPNSSTLATAVQFNHGPSRALRDVWTRVFSNVSPAAPRTDPDTRIQRAAEYFHTHPEAAERAHSVLSALDLGLAGFRVHEIAAPPAPGAEAAAPHVIPVGVHHGDAPGEIYEIGFALESKGTRNLFGILPQLLAVLERGGVMIYDEFEADLHPAMLPHLTGLFTDTETNASGAQMLFSCHSTPLMERLDKYQILLAEKGTGGASDVWRLDDVKGVRADDNYYAKYTAGAYGALGDIELI